MRHSHTSRGLTTSAKTLMAVLGLGLATACSDTVSTPISQVSVQAPAGFNKVLGVQTFTYTPKSGVVQRLGDNVISIPAGAVCDPATSTYGVKFWDAPCNAVNHPIVFTATTFSNDAGVPYVEFQPAVRFAPTKEVDLYLRDGKRTSAQLLAIYWCPTLGSCVDESTTDGAVATHRVGKSSILVRRVKHFSGYVVVSGGDCTDGTIETLDDGSLYCNTDALRGADRSGYMVASGLSKGGTSSAHRKKYDQ